MLAFNVPRRVFCQRYLPGVDTEEFVWWITDSGTLHWVQFIVLRLIYITQGGGISIGKKESSDKKKKKWE